MLYREIIAVCSQIHTEHINTLCGQNVQFVNVKLAVHVVNLSRVEDRSVQKLIICQLIPIFYVIRRFITVLTTAYPLVLCPKSCKGPRSSYRIS